MKSKDKFYKKNGLYMILDKSGTKNLKKDRKRNSLSGSEIRDLSDLFSKIRFSYFMKRYSSDIIMYQLTNIALIFLLFLFISHSHKTSDSLQSKRDISQRLVFFKVSSEMLSFQNKCKTNAIYFKIFSAKRGF